MMGRVADGLAEDAGVEAIHAGVAAELGVGIEVVVLGGAAAAEGKGAEEEVFTFADDEMERVLVWIAWDLMGDKVATFYPWKHHHHPVY